MDSQHNTTSISIVIPSYLRADKLRECLRSILEFTAPCEVILVANGAPEETKTIFNEFAVQWQGEAKMLWFDSPQGFARACNAGIKESQADRIILLNDDCILLGQPKNQWIEILSAPFENEKVGITGVLKNYCPSAQREFLLFFCVMIRREVVDDIGLLDESFEVGAGEDTSYCCEAEDAGWLIKQTPETPCEMVDRGDPSLPIHQQQIWATQFPLYHSAGETVSRVEGFQEVFARNAEILRKRYAVDISRAQQIEGWMADSELEWLARQARKASVFIEIGSWCGRSSRAIADNLPADAILICVDSFNGSSGEPDAHKTAKEREGDGVYMKFLANLYDHIRLGRVIPLRMDSANAAEVLRQKEVKADCVFIDGDHSMEGVRCDIDSFRPLVRDGGILCGHDYYLPEQNPLAWIGVRECVDTMFPDAAQAPNTTIWQVRIDSPWNTLQRSFPITESLQGHGGFFAPRTEAVC